MTSPSNLPTDVYLRVRKVPPPHQKTACDTAARLHTTKWIIYGTAAPDCDLVQQVSELVVVLAEDIEGGQAKHAHHLGDVSGL